MKAGKEVKNMNINNIWTSPAEDTSSIDKALKKRYTDIRKHCRGELALVEINLFQFLPNKTGENT